MTAGLAPTETIRLDSVALENIATTPWVGRAWMKIECNNCPPDAIKVQMTGKRFSGDPLVDLTPEVPEIREVNPISGSEQGTFTLLGFPPTNSDEDANIRIINTDDSSQYSVEVTLYDGYSTTLCSNIHLAAIGPNNLVRKTNTDVETACSSPPPPPPPPLWTDKKAWLQIITDAPAGAIRVQYLVRDNANGTGVLSNLSVGGQQ